MASNLLETEDIGDSPGVTVCYFAYMDVGKILVRYAG